jgi:hypothetical protein
VTDCPDCQAAVSDWTWGGYHSQCPGCEIRAIAVSPRRIREQAYTQWARTYGEEAMQERRKAVLAEYRRIDELRGGNDQG